jgi:hypothetical protein
MSGKKQQGQQEPASGQTEPASAVPATTTNDTAGPAGGETPPAPTKVQALKSNAGGGRRVLATAHINRVGGNLKPGDEFELQDEKEAKRLVGCFE